MNPTLSSSFDWLVGDGEMVGRIRRLNWSGTALGNPSAWPQSLRTALCLMLGSRYPMFTWWGPHLINFYNDAYIPVLGARHPGALGRPARELWAEIWDVIGPQTELVLQSGKATWNERLLLVMQRYGYTEETYFTFSYSPVHDDDGRVAGVFCACTEETARVLADRRLRTLREIATSSLSSSTVEEACRRSINAIAINPYDLPFAILYAPLGNDRILRKICSTGLSDKDPRFPETIEVQDNTESGISGLIHSVVTNAKIEVCKSVNEAFGTLHAGPWPEPLSAVTLLPLLQSGQKTPFGVLIVGISPRLLLTSDYMDFLELAVGQFAAAISEARTLEQEHKRAEALAELDRAKTSFFSNASHEFRTPLTLMLGPLEEMLSSQRAPDSKELEVVHRNGLRLLKLVNALLDFSRIEAGRMKARFVPTDLAIVTADLAGVFRSAVERAGLQFDVQCQPVSQPVYVDPEMWEKVVLNLISNAFKFTFTGRISITLSESEEYVLLKVKDTGVGIPQEEIPRLFERFHRVESTRGRSFEGSGIGLALIHELVKLHGGSIEVESVIGKGTTFTVSIPSGYRHLPADQIQHQLALASAADPSRAYVEEALRWLPENSYRMMRSVAKEEGMGVPEKPAAGERSRVLIADDNSDMREYLDRLLSPAYEVKTTIDGVEAIEAAREWEPDLVLADVMMPRLDGFGLLRELRNDSRLKTLPVILLSARAGEESQLDGLAAGADDYLIKPFSARELLARVRSQLEMARLRRRGEERVIALLDSLTDGFQAIDSNWRFTYMNPALKRIWEEQGINTDVIGKHFFEDVFPGSTDTEIGKDFLRAMNDRKPLELESFYPPLQRWYWMRYFPTVDGGLSVFVRDITERKKAEQSLRESERRFREMADHAPVMIWVTDAFGYCNFLSQSWLDFTGQELAEALGFGWTSAIHPDDRREAHDSFFSANEMQNEFRIEYRLRNKDGEYRWVLDSARPRRDSNGMFIGYIGSVVDIDERKREEKRLALLAEISETTRTMTDANRLLLAVCQALGKHLGVNRCLFNEIDLDQDRETVHSDYFHDLPSVTGVHKISDYSAITSNEMKSGKTIVNCDSKIDPRTANDFHRIYEPNQERAYVAVPLFRKDKWVASLWVSQSASRSWSKQEISLLENIAERTWAAVEKLRINAALRESEERFRQAADASNALIYEVDLTTGLAVVVYGMERITGYNPKQMELTREWWHSLIHPEDIQGHLAELEKSHAHDASYLNEYRIRRKDDVYIVVQDNGMVIRNPDGVATRLIGAITDISGRKRAENAMRDSEQQLQKALAAAQEASRLKDEFLATISHELRTPLNAILGWAHLLKSRPVDPLVAAAAVDAIHTSAKNQAQIIDDLLDVARIVSGKTELEPQKVLISDVLSGALKTMTHAIAAKSLRVNVHFADEGMSLYADPQRMQQVFWNLLSNAVKFTPQQGTIDVRIERTLTDAILTFRDTGIGITQEFIPLVFDRFRQADSSTTRRFGGLGLGLSITKHFVELHGGTVSVHSDGEAAGSTFTVRLPLNSPHDDKRLPLKLPESSFRNQALQNTKLPGVRILIVDDDENTCLLTRDVFAHAGAECKACHSAPEALAIAREWLPDILISDIAMPDYDGYWLIRQLRSLPSPANAIPAIALTAYTSTAHHAEMLAAGFQMFVPKPVEPTELLASIKALLDARTKPSLPARKESSPSSVSNLRGKKILLVEDDLLSVEMLRVAMERHGLEFRTAARASTAMEILRHWLPDIIVSDLGLPDEDGYQLIRKIRALPQPQLAGIPAVALTGYGKEEGDRAIAAGFHVYKRKPIDPESIISLLAGLIKN